jgi:ribosomal protein L7Ae-like RNA K-turn-binding protein
VTYKDLSMLSIAAKAGKVKSGSLAVLNSIRDGEAVFVMITEDASENTKKKFSDKCKYYEVPYMTVPIDCESIGRLIGKESRNVLAITDQGLADSIRKKINSEV